MMGLELPSQKRFLYILWRALNLQYRCWGWNSLARSAFCISYASTQPQVQMLGLELPSQKRFLYNLWRALNLKYRCWDQNFLETFCISYGEHSTSSIDDGLELPRSAFCISYGEHSTSSIDAGVRTPQKRFLHILWRALNLKYRCWDQNSLETFCISYGEHSTSSIDAGIRTPQLEALSVYLMASTQPQVQMLGLELPRNFLYILWRALNLKYRCWDQNFLETFCISYGEHSTSSIDAGIRTPQKLSVYLMARTQPQVQMLGLELPRNFLYILWRALNLKYRCWDQNSLETFCISYGQHSTSSIDAGIRTSQKLSVYLMASTQPQVQMLGLELPRNFLYILWRALNLKYRCWDQNSLETFCISFGEHSTSNIEPGIRTPQKLSAYLMASTQPEVQMLGLELPRSAFCICYGEHSTSSIDAGIRTPQLEALSVYLMASTEPLVQMLGLELPRSFLYILWRALNVQYRCWGWNSLQAFFISYGEHSTSSIDAGIRTSQKLSVYLMASTQRLLQMLGLELPSQKLSVSYGEHLTSSIDAGVRTPQKRFLYILWRALNLQYRYQG